MKTYLYLAAICLLAACNGCNPPPKPTDDDGPTPPDTNEVVMIDVPAFSADSAYAYVAKQVSFGPRVPNTPQHIACKDWMVKKLEGWADDVIVQNTTLTNWQNEKLDAYNVIGVFNPEAKTRIMLCAHWDTRPIADHDSERQEEPILGANDGASGVGVLLEIARVLSQHDIDIGVDIVLFDAEDGGDSYVRDSYCLGSQYWAENPHVNGYMADFGILLDMVGAKGSTFFQEGYSMMYAPSTVNRVWDAAHRLGYGDLFQYFLGNAITDDHYYVNALMGLPTIDIIHRSHGTDHGFGPYWHTHDDDMDVIDPYTLGAVGNVVTRVLFEYANEMAPA